MNYRVNRIVKLRAEPKQDSANPHGIVDRDDFISIVAEKDIWRQVIVADKYSRTRREGFIKAKYLVEKESLITDTTIEQELSDTTEISFTGTGKPLTQENLNSACDLLQVNEAKIWAVLAVETSGFGFFSNRRPRILFERHIFHKQTDGQFDSHSNISNKHSGGYIGGKNEYARLQKAIDLNREAALKSASWGIGQVMGFNFESAGFSSTEEMINAMIETEGKQLPAMINFIKDHGLDTALQNANWEKFAEGYNGPQFKKNDYDSRLALANAKYEIKLPDLKLRSAQASLTYLDFKPGPVDGLRGRRTHSALVQFQEQSGLPVTGELTEQTEIQLMETAF